MKKTNITPLPTPPTSKDVANFAQRADEFVEALPQFQNELNALGESIEEIAKLNKKEVESIALNAKETLKTDLESFEAEISSLGESSKNEINLLSEASKNEIQSLKEASKIEISSLNQTSKSQIQQSSQEAKEEIKATLETSKTELNSLRDTSIDALKQSVYEQIRSVAKDIDGISKNQNGFVFKQEMGDEACVVTANNAQGVVSYNINADVDTDKINWSDERSESLQALMPKISSYGGLGVAGNIMLHYTSLTPPIDDEPAGRSQCMLMLSDSNTQLANLSFKDGEMSQSILDLKEDEIKLSLIESGEELKETSLALDKQNGIMLNAQNQIILNAQKSIVLNAPEGMALTTPHLYVNDGTQLRKVLLEGDVILNSGSSELPNNAHSPSGSFGEVFDFNFVPKIPTQEESEQEREKLVRIAEKINADSPNTIKTEGRTATEIFGEIYNFACFVQSYFESGGKYSELGFDFIPPVVEPVGGWKTSPINISKDPVSGKVFFDYKDPENFRVKTMYWDGEFADLNIGYDKSVAIGSILSEKVVLQGKKISIGDSQAYDEINEISIGSGDYMSNNIKIGAGSIYTETNQSTSIQIGKLSIQGDTISFNGREVMLK